MSEQTQRRPRFDATINLGHIITVLSLLMAGAVGYTDIKVSLARLEGEIRVSGSEIAALKGEIADLRGRVRELELGHR